MTIAEAFLEDIITHPEDDTLRLIYADYLSEHGQEEMAEFIRAQIERAELRCVIHNDKIPPPTIQMCEQLKGECRHCDLVRRESLLFIRNDFDVVPSWVEEWQFTRGFVSRICLSCSSWMEHGPVLVKQHPLERVELSDKEPAYVPDEGPPGFGWRWYNDGLLFPPFLNQSDVLPKALFGQVKRIGFYFPSEQDALDALSVGCLSWAREKGKEGAIPR